MRGERYIAELLRYPWAIDEAYLPLASRVIARIASGLPMSAADRETVEDGRAQWEARARQAGAYAGGAVAVIGVYGLLTQRGETEDMSTPTTSSSKLAATVRAAAADPSIAAIVLDIDSPGGSVFGIEELGNAIFDARAAKPVCAVANSCAASAAYWTAVQASELYAAPGAQVGSIGVYTMHVDQSEALKQQGLNVSYISAGKYKVEASSIGPLNDEARANMQSMIDSYYDSFVRAVARGRGVSLKAVKEGMGQGRMMLPADAQAQNMIDGVATLGQVESPLAFVE